MPTFNGNVTCVNVADGSAFTTIQDSTGTRETFILYFGTTIPPNVTSFTRILHSMWLSMLRDAMTNGLTVKVGHPTGSAAISSVQLGT